MPSVKWSDSYRIGIQEIDNQHRLWFDLFNDFAAKVEANDVKAFERALDRFIENTVCHLKTEESYFEQFGYPESASHKTQHQRFIDRLMDIKTRFQSGGFVSSNELIDSLKEWIIHHVLISDRKYITCFKEHGLL